MLATLCPRVEMVEVDVRRVPTPWDHAASVIATKHQPAYCWLDGLDRALQLDASTGFRAHVGVFIDLPRCS